LKIDLLQEQIDNLEKSGTEKEINTHSISLKANLALFNTASAAADLLSESAA
jgi:hypothetical protein